VRNSKTMFSDEAELNHLHQIYLVVVTWTFMPLRLVVRPYIGLPSRFRFFAESSRMHTLLSFLFRWFLLPYRLRVEFARRCSLPSAGYSTPRALSIDGLV